MLNSFINADNVLIESSGGHTARTADSQSADAADNGYEVPDFDTYTVIPTLSKR